MSPSPLPMLTLPPSGSLLAARSSGRMLRHRLAPPGSALPFAHALEDLDEAEINPPQVHVDADDLHFHLVAEPIDRVVVLAAQQVRAFDEPIVVVRHRRHV